VCGVRFNPFQGLKEQFNSKISFSGEVYFMPQAHVSDYVHQGSVESSLREAETFGIVADADFATDQATTLANIATRNAKLLAGQRADQLSRYYAAVQAVKLGFNLLGTSVMTGGSLATIYAAVDQTWARGFGVAV
jgi:hypothetical protein